MLVECERPAAPGLRRHESTTAATARALHLRRQLEAAAEHGAALLAALGLPRLVEPGFTPINPAEAGDALEAAVAALDALDGDQEAEPWLGWTGAGLGRADPGDTSDREAEPEHDEDDATAEPSLASPERHPRLPEVTWGLAYTARGGEEGQLRWAEGAQHDGELVNEDGDDLDAGEHDTADMEASLGWPEDLKAEVREDLDVYGTDAEQDDADLEDGDQDEDWRGPWPAPRADRLGGAHA